MIIIGSSAAFAENASDETDNTLTVNENINDIQTASQHSVAAGSNSSAIQNTINSMSDGDTLNFENGTYTDICIYVDKNITINGNGATLIGYGNSGDNNSNIPTKIRATTANGGYGISNFATLYLVNATGITLTGLTIVGLDESTYANAALYVSQVSNILIDNNVIDGSSWGIYMTTSPDGVISNNIIKNQKTTGLLNFGSARTLITNNTVINASNHGIDVRHGSGPNVKVINNTVIGSKEGIYLMHSQGHTATENTLINCTISSISCYGSSNINIYNNTMYKSRIGVLLGGGYKNITVGENDYNLDNLPYPPTFVYYVASATSQYQNATNDIGVYSDPSIENETYVNETDIPVPEEITLDYDSIISPAGTVYNVSSDATSSEIQDIIDSMENGDTLNFAENAVYTNISVYTDKNIKIIGNNATLIGYDRLDKTDIAEKVRNKSEDDGYAVAYYAVLYSLNNTDVVISDLNIISQYPKYDTNNVSTTTEEYKTAGIYAEKSINLTVINCNIEGASFGIFLQYSSNSTVANNNIHDQNTNGIINFGSGKNKIIGNNITDAVNHGIDVRHGTGPNVTVFNNTISGAKEGIYLMHSSGHMVYNNTIINSKISSITALGSSNEYIFNNTMNGSRIALLLSNNYENVTVGENTYNLDTLPFPPTFATYIAFADAKYQSSENVQGTYSDGMYLAPSTIIADDTISNSTKFEYTVILKDNNGIGVANESLVITVDGKEYNVTTDDNGTAAVELILKNGEYTVLTYFAGNDNLSEKSQQSEITVNSSRAVDLDVPSIELYYKNGTRMIVSLTKNGTALSDQELAITINGVNKTYKTNENGTVSIGINLESGDYPISTYYNGSEEYDPALAESVVSVLPTVKGDNIEKIYKNRTQYYATFLDGQGNILANENVSFNINGVDYTRKTNENGTAKLNINLYIGEYIITATNPVTNESRSNNITVKSSVKAEDIVKYERNGTQYLATFFDGEGNPLANGTEVTFNINGVMYKRSTNENGTAKLNINLHQGNYTITAINPYNDQPFSNNIEVLPVLQADDLTKNYGDADQFIVHLVDGEGNSLPDATVSFNINGVFYDRVTNDTGYAILNIRLPPGEYIITSSYNGTAISNKIKVNA